MRYADDLVIATERKDDADNLSEALQNRFEKFKLKLHPKKTKIVRFGKKWVAERKRGGDKPGTFNFLGFTHISGSDRKGRYLVKRKTMKKRLRRAIKKSYQECRIKMHAPICEQHKRLTMILTGHYNYYGLRGNFDQLKQFYYAVWKMWYRSLNRRSQKGFKYQRRYELLLERFPYPALKLPILKVGLRSNRVTCLEESFAGNPLVRFCEGEIQ